MQFKGIFFDGKSSTGYKADIELNTYYINITYFDTFETKTVQWDPHLLHKTDFAATERVILKYGEFPYQSLEVNDVLFANALRNMYPKAAFHRSTYNFIFKWGALGITGVIVSSVAFVALLYFVVVPFVAERFAARLPISVEKQFGDIVFDKIIADEKIDNENSRRLTAFFKELNYPDNYDVHVYMVKDKIVNAFALPGGKILVYEGIMREMNNSNELVALLSHEYSHVSLKHSTRNLFRSLSSYMFVSILFGDASGVTAVVVQNADKLKQLGYSRQLEEDADKNGLKLMKQRQLDPQGMYDLFQVLKKSEGDYNGPQFLSTHPLTNTRIEYVQRDIAKKNYRVVTDARLDSLFKVLKTNIDE